MDIPPQLQAAYDHAAEAGSRHAASGDPADLDEALMAVNMMVRQWPSGHPGLDRMLVSRAQFLIQRYDVAQAPADLDAAIEALGEAIEQTPAGSRHLAARYRLVGLAHMDRYLLRGQPPDLDAAVERHEAAAALMADDDDLSAQLEVAARCLHERFRRDGALGDLDETVTHLRRARESAPADAELLPGVLGMLGTVLLDRFSALQDARDLQEATELLREAVRTTPAGSTPWENVLNDLAICLMTPGPEDETSPRIDECIRIYRGAVQRQTDPVERAISLNNLARALLTRYQDAGALGDVQESIELLRQALPDVPDGHRLEPTAWHNLAIALEGRYMATGSPADLQDAREAVERCCLVGLEVAPGETLEASLEWINHALEHSAWADACRAYELGHQAEGILLRNQLLTRSKRALLLKIGNLHPCAAYALARAGDLVGAVVALEQGNARLLTVAMERERADLERVREHSPQLHRRCRDAAERLRSLEGLERAANRDDAKRTATVRVLDLRDLVRRARGALEEAAVQIRALPGFEDFLAEPDLDEIAAAVQPDTAVVYVLTSVAGALALVVVSDPDGDVDASTGGQGVRVEAVWGDRLREARLLQALLGVEAGDTSGYAHAYALFEGAPADPEAQEVWCDALDHMTGLLGETLMGPVVERLERLGVRRAVLVATGYLSWLPLHAARLGDGQRAVDRVILSWAPSAGVLPHLRHTAATSPASPLVAVQEPRPVTGGAPLASAAMEVEAVAAHFDDARVLVHEQCTVERVLDALSGAGVAHFSCHGDFSVEEILTSGLIMSGDVVLSVEDLYDLHLEGARLATISACETGLVGGGSPDEAVGLPSALLQAGFAGVVASLWPVPDVATAMLMERFYVEWRGRELEPAEALRQAQRWLRDTTNGEKAAHFKREILAREGRRLPAASARGFFMQAVVRHPAARDFEHPFFWAGFFLTGV